MLLLPAPRDPFNRLKEDEESEVERTGEGEGVTAASPDRSSAFWSLVRIVFMRPPSSPPLLPPLVAAGDASPLPLLLPLLPSAAAPLLPSGAVTTSISGGRSVLEADDADEAPAAAAEEEEEEPDWKREDRRRRWSPRPEGPPTPSALHANMARERERVPALMMAPAGKGQMGGVDVCVLA